MLENLPIRTQRRYGWRPDLPDHRDVLLGLAAPTVVLPPVVSLRDQFPAPYDQGPLGSCTANALAGLFEHRQTVERHDRPVTPSRLFVYYGERLIEGTVDSDAGAEIRDGIKVLAKVGAPPETAWPYDTSKFAVKPPVSVYKTATKFEAVRYARVPRDVRSMQSQLAKGNPFAFGFSVYASFESDAVARTGIAPLPAAAEELLGGHAVVAVGYKAIGSLLYFEVRNSWGAGWGDAGYFWMPAPYLNSRGLASDFWTVTSVSA